MEDCVAEFEDIIGDARTDSLTIIRELKGIRQALTSGLASGTVAATMSDGDEQMKRPTPMNAQLLRNQFPITNNSPVMVQEINHILQDRTELVRQLPGPHCGLGTGGNRESSSTAPKTSAHYSPCSVTPPTR